MRPIDADRLQKQFNEKSSNPNYRVNMHNIKSIISNAPTVEAIPKANVYKAIQEMMKYEHEGFINISLVKFSDIIQQQIDSL